MGRTLPARRAAARAHSIAKLASGGPEHFLVKEFNLKDSVRERDSQIGRWTIGLGWAKSHSFQTGQTPVLKYNRQLMQAILHDKIHIAKAVNVTVISLDDAPKGYVDFDKGAAKKFVIDPHALLAA